MAVRIDCSRFGSGKVTTGLEAETLAGLCVDIAVQKLIIKVTAGKTINILFTAFSSQSINH
jgi:hypothetical protein